MGSALSRVIRLTLINYGIIIVLVTRIGVITPPVGINVYVVSGVAADVKPEDIFKGSMPFLIALIVGTVCLVAFSQTLLRLPSLTY